MKAVRGEIEYIEAMLSELETTLLESKYYGSKVEEQLLHMQMLHVFLIFAVLKYL